MKYIMKIVNNLHNLPEQGNLCQRDLEFGLFCSGITAEYMQNKWVSIKNLYSPGFLKFFLKHKYTIACFLDKMTNALIMTIFKAELFMIIL